MVSVPGVVKTAHRAKEVLRGDARSPAPVYLPCGRFLAKQPWRPRTGRITVGQHDQSTVGMACGLFEDGSMGCALALDGSGSAAWNVLWVAGGPGTEEEDEATRSCVKGGPPLLTPNHSLGPAPAKLLTPSVAIRGQTSSSPAPVSLPTLFFFSPLLSHSARLLRIRGRVRWKSRLRPSSCDSV